MLYIRVTNDKLEVIEKKADEWVVTGTFRREIAPGEPKTGDCYRVTGAVPLWSPGGIAYSFKRAVWRKININKE